SIWSVTSGCRACDWPGVLPAVRVVSPSVRFEKSSGDALHRGYRHQKTGETPILPEGVFHRLRGAGLGLPSVVFGDVKTQASKDGRLKPVLHNRRTITWRKLP